MNLGVESVGGEVATVRCKRSLATTSIPAVVSTIELSIYNSYLEGIKSAVLVLLIAICNSDKT